MNIYSTPCLSLGEIYGCSARIQTPYNYVPTNNGPQTPVVIMFFDNTSLYVLSLPSPALNTLTPTLHHPRHLQPLIPAHKQLHHKQQPTTSEKSAKKRKYGWCKALPGLNLGDHRSGQAGEESHMPERVQKEVLSTDQRKLINVTLMRARMATFLARSTRLLSNMKAQVQYNAAPRHTSAQQKRGHSTA